MKRVRDPYSARLTIMDCKSFFSWFTSCSFVEPETSKEEKSSWHHINQAQGDYEFLVLNQISLQWYDIPDFGNTDVVGKISPVDEREENYWMITYTFRVNHLHILE